MKILLVCLGNICRSPMAEVILRDRLKNANMAVEVDSAGTSDFHIDEAPDKRAIANMKQHGHDISMLRGRQFTADDYDNFDCIYAMDESNRENIVALARNEDDKKKVNLFLNIAHPGENMEVPDPYFGGDEGFESVYNMMDQSAEVLVSQIREGKV